MPQALTKYTPERALDICEFVAEGGTLTDICTGKDGMPVRATFHRWCAQYPDLHKAYLAARELSALSLEEEALGLARKLKNAGSDITGVKVRAFEVAMAQFRWSAVRRDPKRYGQSAEKSSAVNIQINTTLDLGSDGAGPGLEGQAIYTVTAHVPAEPEATEDRDDVTPEELEREASLFHVPEKSDRLLNPPMSRHEIARKAGLARHDRGRKIKSEAAVKAQITKQRKKAEAKENGSS
jgi:hypothetical protein